MKNNIINSPDDPIVDSQSFTQTVRNPGTGELETRQPTERPLTQSPNDSITQSLDDSKE